MKAKKLKVKKLKVKKLKVKEMKVKKMKVKKMKVKKTIFKKMVVKKLGVNIGSKFARTVRKARQVLKMAQDTHTLRREKMGTESARGPRGEKRAKRPITLESAESTDTCTHKTRMMTLTPLDGISRRRNDLPLQLERVSKKEKAGKHQRRVYKTEDVPT